MVRRDKKFVVGNWKMNHNLQQVSDFILEVTEQNCYQWVAPQSIHIAKLKELNSLKSNLTKIITYILLLFIVLIVMIIIYIVTYNRKWLSRVKIKPIKLPGTTQS